MVCIFNSAHDFSFILLDRYYFSLFAIKTERDSWFNRWIIIIFFSSIRFQVAELTIKLAIM